MIYCSWEDEPHTVWYWDSRDASVMPVPLTAQLDNHADAIAYIDRLGTPDWLGWVKAFRQNNGAYECYQWRAPARPVPPPPPPYRPLEPGSDPTPAMGIGWAVFFAIVTLAVITGFVVGAIVL